MKLFHLMTVASVDVAAHELPAVRYGDYYLVGKSMKAAFAAIHDYTDVSLAAEVFGVEINVPSRVDGVIVSPRTNLNQRVTLQQHRHWANVQKRYKLIATGAESPEDFVSRRFAENHLQYA